MVDDGVLENTRTRVTRKEKEMDVYLPSFRRPPAVVRRCFVVLFSPRRFLHEREHVQ